MTRTSRGLNAFMQDLIFRYPLTTGTSTMRASMRALVLGAISLGLTVNIVRADGPSISNQLPQNTKDQQVYLFMLKVNSISLHMKPQDFCSRLGYGDAVQNFWGQGADEIGKDGKTTIPGELQWVICQFPPK
jgi:hypothetical protein